MTLSFQIDVFKTQLNKFPGTKWCGVNDIAENYHDLGEDRVIDKCCRAHDHCPIKIKPFDRNFGVFNYHPYTK